jgi:site-specific DNA-methyltransferase (adenine-specific)
LDLFKKAGYSKSRSHEGDGEKIDTRGVGWGFKRLPGGFNDEGTPNRFFYCAKVTTKERNEGLKQHKNHHPTVKPLSLMRYIVRLVTPKGGVVLDPFAGSGTTGVACVLDGYRFICIEKEKEYVDVAKEKIEYYKNANLFYNFYK